MKRLILFAVLLLIWTLPAAAQSASCAIMLNQASAVLDRMQANSGDTAHAADLLSQLRGLLDRYEANCLGPRPSLELGDETFTLRYARDTGRALTFATPAGWIVQHDRGDQQVGFTTSDGLTERLNSSDLPAFNSGEALIYVIAGSLDELGMDLDSAMRPAEMLTALMQTEEQITVTGEPFAFSVDDRAAARATFAGTGFEGALYIITLPNSDIALMFTLTAPGESVPVDDLVLQIARSMRTTRADFTGSQDIESDGLSFTFHYPDGWALQEVRDGLYALGNSSQLLADKTFGGADFPDMAPGEVAAVLTVNTAQTYGFDTASGSLPSPREVLESVIRAVSSLPGTLGDVTSLQIGEQAAAQVDLIASGYAARILILDLGSSRFALIVLVTAPGELERNAGVALGVAASFESP